MFLLLPLLPALTAPLVLTASVENGERFALALDEACALVLVVGDLASAEDERGQWLEFVCDSDWFELLDGFAAMGDEEESEPDEMPPMAELLPRFAGLLGRLRGGALGLLGEDTERMQALLEVDAGWLEEYALAVEQGAQLTTDAQGRTRLEWVFEDSGDVLVGLQAGSFVAFAGEVEGEAAQASCEALLENLERDADATRNPWWTACDARCAEPLAELFVDGRRMAEEEEFEELRAILGVPELIYVGLGVGQGPEGELVMRMELEEAPVFDLLESCFQEADLSLLRFATDGHIGTVLGLDFAAALEAGVELAERNQPGAEEQFEAGIQAANALLGVDLRADFLAELTGQLLMLRKVPDYEALAAAAAGEDAEEALEEAMPTLALTIGDEDAILATLEPLMRLAAAQGIPCESRDVEEGAFWTLDPGLGAPLGVGVGSGFLVVGLEASALELLEMARGGGPRGYLSPERLTDLARELDGSFVSVSPLDETLAALESMGDFVQQFAASEEDGEAMTLVVRAAAIARRHLTGLVGLTMDFDSGMAMRIVTR